MFTLQLILSFVVGGLFIALQTLIAERVPLAWRGIVLTLPSTMAMGLLFIGLTKSPQDVVETVKVIPASEGIAYVYFVFFILLTTRLNLILSLIGAIISWAFLAFAILKFPPPNFLVSILYLAVTIIPTYLIIIRLPQVTNLKIFPINLKHITVRSLLGGTIIALAVFLSKTLGNTWGGLFATFPAVFTSTLIIYYHLQGKNVLPSIGKSLYLPGVFGYLVYAWIVAMLYPRIGIWLGTLSSYLVLLIFLFVWNFLVGKSSGKLPQG